MKRAHAQGARLRPICRVLGLSLRTLERWQASSDNEDRRRGPLQGPVNKLSTEECQSILHLCCSPEFVDQTPRQIVIRLADRGTYLASESSFYRILRAHELLAHRGKARAPRYVRPKELLATRPNQVWSWDITYLRTQVVGIFFYLYLVMDIYSRKILSWHLDIRQSEKASSTLIKKTCEQENVKENELFIHSDNGGPMRGSTMLATLQKLGVIPSFSRPHVSNDNAFSEALFKTLKYHPIYPLHPFKNLNEAKSWVERFVSWYNFEHLHSQISYVTPQSRYLGEDRMILEKRSGVYLEAKARTPQRWSKNIRRWEAKPFVVLNPLQVNLLKDIQSDVPQRNRHHS